MHSVDHIPDRNLPFLEYLLELVLGKAPLQKAKPDRACQLQRRCFGAGNLCLMSKRALSAHGTTIVEAEAKDSSPGFA